MDRSVESFLSQPREGSHLGVIFQNDAFIAEVVAEWVAPALTPPGGAILIGTPTHLEAVRHVLRSRGIDVAARERTGHAVLLDADWLLAKFMLDGSPDATVFRALLDEILQGMTRVVGSTAGIRAWGEMVSLLRLRGNAKAAQRLEQLWEEVLAAHGLSLLCSYHTGEGDVRPSVDLLRDVARTHGSWLLEPAEAAPATQGMRGSGQR